MFCRQFSYPELNVMFFLFTVFISRIESTIFVHIFCTKYLIHLFSTMFIPRIESTILVRNICTKNWVYCFCPQFFYQELNPLSFVHIFSYQELNPLFLSTIFISRIECTVFVHNFCTKNWVYVLLLSTIFVPIIESTVFLSTIFVSRIESTILVHIVPKVESTIFFQNILIRNWIHYFYPQYLYQEMNKQLLSTIFV